MQEVTRHANKVLKQMFESAPEACGCGQRAPRCGRTPEGKPVVTREVPLEDLIKKPSPNLLRRQRAEGKVSEQSKGLNLLDALQELIASGASGQASAASLNLLRGRSAGPQLCAFQTPDERGAKPTRDPRTWEVISAVVDSGATITALKPGAGKGYPIEESPASREGVEYETAADTTLPDLGMKRMAVLTPEGTLRGYQSEVVDVSSNLESVRRLCSNKHCVLFGLGPDDNDHLIINKVSGEVNRMRDDGTNYLHDLLVVPPEFLEEVMAEMSGQTPGAAPVGRQG